MENGIKLKLSPEELEALVQAAFGMGLADSEELSDGWANTAYRIGLPDGRRTVLKLAPLPEVKMMRYEVELMRTEVELLRRLEGSLPVPKVLAYDNSRSIVPSDYFFMEHLEGTPYNKLKPDMTPGEREAVERQLGNYNRQLNEARGERFGPYLAAAPGESSWAGVFLGMVRDVLADGREMGAELPMAEEEVVALVKSCEKALNQVTEPRLVHWDLWDGNVFVKEGQICGLIDFERALWADPLMEAYFRKMMGTEAFLEGYGIKRFTDAEKARIMLYDLYLDLILLIECLFRGYNSPQHEKWARDHLAAEWERIVRELG